MFKSFNSMLIIGFKLAIINEMWGYSNVESLKIMKEQGLPFLS